MDNIKTLCFGVLITLIGYFVWVENNTIELSTLCDFQRQNCTVAAANGQIYTLKANPKNVQSEAEITFTLVSSQHNAIKIISAWIEGKDMYMGKIPLFFNENKYAPKATTMIGVCTEDSMVWVMHITIEIDGKIEHLLFDFKSYK